RSGTAYLLFPHEDAIPIEEVTPEGGVHLIVPDGSWRRARKMCQRHPLLRDLPRVFVRPQGESRYFARRQGRSHGVCTYEAVAWALKALEGEEIYEKMMKQFGLAMGALWRSRQGNPDALEPNGQDVYPGPK
ncbi:DTW domain-containing protein, partial [Myxococcota bacterium]|nr:DTW domain-containing protein [Myxococcota bacterium]MBU1535898.1 DTW domain-containing protein [Myxococcota bacterium]